MSTDRQTLHAYDANAGTFAQDWHDQPAPIDLQAIVQQFFRPGLTADIGCGSGREVAWLCGHGFPAIGYDPSTGLLAEARTRYPRLRFETAALPDLAGIADLTFDNVLCETVIMHLPQEAIAASVRRLTSILKPDGILYLSWRVTEGTDRRDAYGRLYAAIDAEHVLHALSSDTILVDAQLVSASSGKAVRRLVVRRGRQAGQ